jgi:aconitate decarboxylase
MTSKPLTRGLAEWVAEPPFLQVPEDVQPLLRTAFVDTVACMFSGEHEAVTQMALTLVQNRGSLPQVRLVTGQARLSVSDAAFVSAVSAHALDYDDMALNGHPSVVLVPALLATGEHLGTSDALLLKSYLVGYEVWAELVGREPDSLHTKGWHPTSVIGTVAVAAAVAHLMGLNAAQTSNALGIAGSMSCGLMGNFGSMTKPLHAGWAAEHGVHAAQLATLGVTASADILESKVGFLSALSPKSNADRSEWTPPDALRIRHNGLSIKKYPVCYAAHRVIDGMLELKRAHGFSAADIRSITPTLSTVTASVLHAHRPQTGLQAKFSIEFACAMAASDGLFGLPQVTDEQVQRADIQALMERVKAKTVEPGCPIEPGFALHDEVTVELMDGTQLDSGPVRFARGHAKRPLPADGITAKWQGCLAHRSHPQHELLARLQQLGDSADNELSQWLHLQTD